MDESKPTNSTGTTGNLEVPEWLLKRRARLAEQAAARRVAEESAPHTTDPREPPLSDSARTDQVATAVPDTEVILNVPVVQSAPVKPILAKSPVIRPVTTPTAADVPTIILRPPLANTADGDEEETPVPWYANWKIDRAAMKSYAISVAMHLLIAIPLSMVAFQQEISNMGLNTLMAFNSDSTEGESLDESQTFTIDTSGGQTGEVLDTILSASAVSSALGPAALKVPDDAGGARLGEGEGAGNQIGNDLSVGGYKMPEAGKFVRKGSFTAWTEPADPAPGEDYKIIIQVQYKKKEQKVSAKDISGSVIGTDKFRLMISQYTSEIIPEANQVVVNIPGAAAQVRDTIRVYSAVLKENQRLEIVF